MSRAGSCGFGFCKVMVIVVYREEKEEKRWRWNDGVGKVEGASKVGGRVSEGGCRNGTCKVKKEKVK